MAASAWVTNPQRHRRQHWSDAPSKRSTDNYERRSRSTGHFPNEDVARKLICLTIHTAIPQWIRTRGWTKALLTFKSTLETGYPTNPPTQ